MVILNTPFDPSLVLVLLQQLYNEGARFFWIHNIGPIGCLPRTSVRNKPNPEGLDYTVCRKIENEIAQVFNKQLKDIVLELRKKLPNAKYTSVDVYSAKYELIKDAKNQGDDFSFNYITMYRNLMLIFICLFIFNAISC